MDCALNYVHNGDKLRKPCCNSCLDGVVINGKAALLVGQMNGSVRAYTLPTLKPLVWWQTAMQRKNADVRIVKSLVGYFKDCRMALLQELCGPAATKKKKSSGCHPVDEFKPPPQPLLFESNTLELIHTLVVPDLDAQGCFLHSRGQVSYLEGPSEARGLVKGKATDRVRWTTYLVRIESHVD
ncbi:hypothetical protein FOZ63_029502, partial [Perkinsus olseni]